MVYVGANDGFLHAFDAGVFDRDTVHFPGTFDLGTGREIFAYAPKSIMPISPSSTSGFANLLNFPPKVQYFVDGSPVVADVFIDTDHAGAPNPDKRIWRTVLVSGLRQGGHSYFSLDVTQPDKVNADGTKSNVNKDSAPDCLDGKDDEDCAFLAYPTVLWEMTDNVVPAMGETWSRPVVGRIHVKDGIGFKDRYVAIFGGGFDASFVPNGSDVTDPLDPTQGRAIYIVNVETGKVEYKATKGTDTSKGFVNFAPIPAHPAVADVDDDGYLDIAYIGDLNGRMWRLDLRRLSCTGGCGTAGEMLTSLDADEPFLLYDAMTGDQKVQPIFLDAGIIFVSGGTSPVLGVGFGTGYRAELLRANPNVNRLFFVLDPGLKNKTFHETDLVNITPEGGITPSGDGPMPTHACTDDGMTDCGYYLDFAGKRIDDLRTVTYSLDEKAVSTVFHAGNLSVVTFIPDSTVRRGTAPPTATALQQRPGAYNLDPSVTATNQLTDYQQVLGKGLATAGQSQSPTGDMIDTVLFSGGGVYQKNSPSTLKTINQNWKEQ